MKDAISKSLIPGPGEQILLSSSFGKI